jgi:hypothetical protein
MNLSPYQCSFGSYSLAAPEDHKDMAVLLRAFPEPGDVRLIRQREPNFFADSNLFGKSAAIIGRSPRGRPVFMCEMREYPVYLAGGVAPAVYLGLLRAAGAQRRLLAVLEHGFVAVRLFARRLGFAEEFFTAVPHGNARLKAIVEAGFAKLPRHVALGDVQSLLLPVPGDEEQADLPADYSVSLAAAHDAQELEKLLAVSGSGWSYAPAPSAVQWLSLLGQEKPADLPFDMLVLRHKGLIVGCVGIWDQRGHRQLLVEGYSLSTNLLRLVHGITARDAPALPAPGNRLELVSLPFFSILHRHVEAGKLLLKRAAHQAGAKGGQICSLSLSVQNPLLRRLDLKGLSRHIRIYRVVFPGPGLNRERKLFAPQPELALL